MSKEQTLRPIVTVQVEDGSTITVYFPQQMKDGYVVTDSSGTQSWRRRIMSVVDGRN